MPSTTILSHARYWHARRAGDNFARFLLQETDLDFMSLPLGDWRRDLFRLCQDAFIAFAIEHEQMQPSLWQAPYTHARQGSVFPSKDPWAAPLCINAALTLWREQVDFRPVPPGA